MLFAHLAEVWKQLNASSTSIIDTMPVPALDNIRIPRAQLYREEAFRGYIQSKRRYFFGLRVCLLTTAQGEPVEIFLLLPGSLGDGEAVKRCPYDLPPGSIVYADRGCTDYTTEDLRLEAQDVHLSACARRTLRARCCPGSSTCSSTGAKWPRPLAAVSSCLSPFMRSRRRASS